MTTKQIIASQRNWLKARVTGLIFIVRPEVTTEKEKRILKEIDRLRSVLLDEWTQSSEQLGMITKPQKDRFKEE